MGVFSRFKDIISSNINAMLDKAEDPEKMIRLMIQEMEETLVEMKASCAGLMADRAKIGRDLDDARKHAQKWSERAQLAVEKGRDDLAREALCEKQRFTKACEDLEEQVKRFEELISKSQNDIARLEEKIVVARQKQRLLIQRHIQAQRKMQAETSIRNSGSADAVRKFDQYEGKVDRMEAAAELVNPKTQGNTLENEFAKLESNETIEQELAVLKKEVKKQGAEK